jgi:hypothetical protein
VGRIDNKLDQTPLFVVDGELTNLQQALASDRWPANRQVEVVTCNWPPQFDGKFLDPTVDYLNACALAAFEADRETVLN